MQFKELEVIIKKELNPLRDTEDFFDAMQEGLHRNWIRLPEYFLKSVIKHTVRGGLTGFAVGSVIDLAIDNSCGTYADLLLEYGALIDYMQFTFRRYI